MHDRLLDEARGRSRAGIGLAEASENEERIVDPHTQADHRRELGGEVGRIDDVREERDQSKASTEAKERGDNRQAHGDERAEGDEQHDDRREQSNGGREPEAFALGALNRKAAQLNLQSRPASSCSHGDDMFAGILRQVVGLS